MRLLLVPALITMLFWGCKTITKTNDSEAKNVMTPASPAAKPYELPPGSTLRLIPRQTSADIRDIEIQGSADSLNIFYPSTGPYATLQCRFYSVPGIGYKRNLREYTFEIGKASKRLLTSGLTPTVDFQLKDNGSKVNKLSCWKTNGGPPQYPTTQNLACLFYINISLPNGSSNDPLECDIPRH